MNERYLTYQERGYWLKMDGPPCSESYPPAGVDRPKEMVELTAAGQIPPGVLDRNGDDFHQGGLKSDNKSAITRNKDKNRLTIIGPCNLLGSGPPHVC